MTIVFKILSALGLALTVGPAFLVFAGRIPIELHYTLMLVGTIVWFLSAPFWMLKKKSS